MQLITFSEDFTLVHLSPRQWARLTDLWSRPPKKHSSGGYQDRLAAWKVSANPVNRTVLLRHAKIRPDRDDDMTWIEHQIINKHGGGWQGHIAFCFEDSHPRFTGLPVKPKRR